jgi:hypothetical protein
VAKSLAEAMSQAFGGEYCCCCCCMCARALHTESSATQCCKGYVYS